MKKNNLIIFSIFFLFAAKAQINFSWFPIHPNIQYNYKVDSSSAPISNVIKIDSVSANSPYIYYLNKIVTNCDTCINSQLTNNAFDSTYVLNSQPQFLNHSFSNLSNTVFCFKGIKSTPILPFATIGFNWIYDTTQNITASVVSRSVQTILGTPDSVCVIKLSTNDTILLSKNTGIIQFPIKTINTHYYKLVGTEGNLNTGIKLKTFHDFFNFNVGDVLQFSFETNDFNTLPPLLQNGRERWDFLAVTVYTDSVCCKIRKTHYDSLKIGNSIPAITAYTHTVNISFIDSATHMANLFPLQEIWVNPYFVFDNGIMTIHKIKTDIDNNLKVIKTFGENCPNINLTPGNTGAAVVTNFNNVFLNENSKKIVGRELIEGLGFTSELYNDYSYVYQNCLIGYIKGNDTSGVIINNAPDLIKENTLQNKYSIHPVPANNMVTIAGALEVGTKVNIVNSFGQKIQEEIITSRNTVFNINVAELTNGVYIIVISNQNLPELKKLIIQR